jgi:uncharacterized protein
VLESQSGDHVTIAWQGGEPTLMGLDFFQHVMELVHTFARPGIEIEHSLQTNGTRLTSEWCDFFRDNHFLIGLSLDGPAPMHNAYRVDKAGRGTFDQVIEAARLMQQAQVDFNILCTVHAANADHPQQVYHFFRDELGVQFIQFIPIVERATTETLPAANQGWGTGGKKRRPLYQQAGSLTTLRTVSAEKWGRFLITIFDEWVKRDVGKVYVQLFDAALASWVGMPPAVCIFAETCGDALALEHNGDLYACDHFVEPAYFLGNIHQQHMLEMVSSPQQRSFGANKRDSLPRYCRECEVKFACQGECPRNRFIQAPDAEPGLNYLCEGYKAFFKHVDRPMRLMGQLLRQGRAPAEVMGILASQELQRLQGAMAQAQPNDPCPCGSGKTYSNCHGRKKSPR